MTSDANYLGTVLLDGGRYAGSRGLRWASLHRNPLQAPFGERVGADLPRQADGWLPRWRTVGAHLAGRRAPSTCAICPRQPHFTRWHQTGPWLAEVLDVKGFMVSRTSTIAVNAALSTQAKKAQDSDDDDDKPDDVNDVIHENFLLSDASETVSG